MAQNSTADRPASGPDTAIPSRLRIWRQIVAPGDLVFDIGANVGNKAAELLERGARVVCVEPQPHCVQQIRARFGGHSDVSVVDKGVASHPGTLQLSICREKDYISTFAKVWKTGRFSEEKWEETVDVEVTTLDELIQAHGKPRFCKIDVEGFELEALNGLSERIAFLSFEYSAEFQETARACLIRLNQLGYRYFNFSFGESQQFSHDDWLSSRELLDYLARQPDLLFWGDIYARAEYQSQPNKPVDMPEGELWQAGEKPETKDAVLQRLAGTPIASKIKSLCRTGPCHETEREAFQKLFPNLVKVVPFNPNSRDELPDSDLLVLDGVAESYQLLHGLRPDFRKQIKLIYLEAVLPGAPGDKPTLDEIRTLIEPDYVFLGFAPDRIETPARGHALFINRNERPRVSAIVSTYNSERFLRACLNDLEAQTIAHELEIIVVDSGSQQNERAIVEEFQQRYNNIVYLRTERESLYAAWNRGVRMAKGRYITNANTDDSHRADALELLAAALAAYPQADLAYGDYYTSSVPNDTFDNPQIMRCVAHPPLHPATLMFYCVTGCHPMWRRTVFDRVGLFDPFFTSPGDYEYLLRCLQAGFRAVRVPEYITLFYQNPEGISFGAQEKSNQEWAIIQNRYRNSMPIERLYKVDPANPDSIADAWTAFGNLAMNHHVPWFDNCAQDIDYALVCYQNALYHKPTHLAALNNLAMARINRGRMDNMEALLRNLPRECLDKIVNNLKRGQMEIIPVDAPPAVEPLDYIRPGTIPPPAQAPATCSSVKHPIVQTPVRWLAPFLTPGQYSRDALNLIEPLNQCVECLTTLDRSEPYSDDYQTSLPAQTKAVLRKTREHYNFALGGICVCEHASDQFTRVGGAIYNIGRTTIESDRLPLGRAKICNQTDEIWVPSRFVLEAMVKGGVERRKLFVLPPAIDAREFDPDRVVPLPLPGRAGWNLLSIFEWSECSGWDVLLGAYFREFSGSDDICLYVLSHLPEKTAAESAAGIRRAIEKHIVSLAFGDRNLPRIEVLEIADQYLPHLYRAADCFVAPTRGEGWGRAHLEAMTMRLPVIATGWGSHTDYLSCENGWPISYELVPVRAAEPELLHLRGQRWAEPSETHLRQLLRHASNNPEEAAAKGRLARIAAEKNCARDVVTARAVERLAAIEQKLTVAACPEASCQPLTPVPEFPDAQPQTVNVAWEGPFLDTGSIAHVNRELSRCLARQPRLHLTCLGRNKLPPHMSNNAVLQETARRLRITPSKPPQVTIRHSWPPNWQRPSAGAWILIQPWEYSVLPADWVRRLAQVDEIWVPSEFTRRAFVDSGVDPFKVKVVPNGIDPGRFHPGASPVGLPTSKTFKFLFVGGAILRKGIDVLLDAYLKSFTAADDVCLVIKGFGKNGVYATQTLSAEIKAAQEKAGAPEILYLVDELPPEAMPGLYTACNALVHPYRGEGFGLPILEAMACGLPVITTAGGASDDFAPDEFVYRIPSLRKKLAQSISGMKLVHTGSWLDPQLQALAAALRRIIAQPEEARNKGRAASDYVRREWTWERSAAIASQRIQDLIERQRRTALNAPAPVGPAAQPTQKEIPPVAAIGSLDEARGLLDRRQLEKAWVSASEALRRRPFHPVAVLLLAEIAALAGDIDLARECVIQAQRMAPKWAAPATFLKTIKDRPSTASFNVPDVLNVLETWKSSPRLSICLITRNEERFLAQCLKSLSGMACQIIVVDTGSSDRTVEIATEMGAEVHTFAWTDDFSAARNAALEHATGDWVLALDADEELMPESRDALLREMSDTSAIAFRLPIFDAGKEANGCNYVPRLFRNAPGVHYVGRIHEAAFSSLEDLRKSLGMENKIGKVKLKHHGYSKAVKKSRDKITRNVRLLDRALRETPEDPNLLMNLGIELMNSGQHEEGLNCYRHAFRSLSGRPAGQISPEVREALLTQFSHHLLALTHSGEVVRILQSPLARQGGLTASQHFTLGMALVDLEQFEKAAESFRQCIAKRDHPALTPINPDIRKAGPHHCLALCLSKLEQNGAAETAFRTAVSTEPKSRPIRFDYARWLGKKGRAVEALQILHQLTTENPSDSEAWHLGGHIALAAGTPEFLDFADTWTREAIKSLPQSSLILGQREEVLRRRRVANQSSFDRGGARAVGSKAAPLVA
jgi:FkbM family methyltransferase